MKYIPIEIREAQEQIEKEQGLIEIHLNKIEELSFKITQYLKNEKNRKTQELASIEPQKYSKATMEFIEDMKKKGRTPSNLYENLFEPVGVIYGTNLAKKLNALGYYYNWQIVRHSAEFWAKIFKPYEAECIVSALAMRGLNLGMDYMEILLYTDKFKLDEAIY